MPTTTGLAIVTSAFDTLGVYAPGQSISAADANTGLSRLNAMVSSWAIQSLTIPSVAREVFPITADLGVYTIGPRGDFDTTRPNELQAAALLLNSDSSTSSVSTLTSSGNVATATVTSHGYEDGQNVTISGASPAAYNGTYAVTSTGANTFTYVFFGGTSPATGTITALLEDNSTGVVEIPVAVLTDTAWQAIQIKSLTSTLFTVCYYNPTFAAGLGTINLWPIPTVSTNSLVLYRQQQLTQFVSLTANYDIADGYEEALAYGLARRLITPYGVNDAQTVEDVRDMAATSLGNIKRANTKLADLSTDPALVRDPRGGYNIITGTGGGGY